ncbi:MAG: methyl-accepting chemotaxis protein [Magnetococcales bacterium]|nr:methyl-accepting chemotaxis protein [Magnetococcales bacterium]
MKHLMQLIPVNFSTRIIILTGFLIFLILSTVISYGIEGTALIRGRMLDSSETTAMSNLLDHAHQSQFHFKKQVQEWKNILLRGWNPKDFEKYQRQFRNEENNVRELLGKVGQETKTLGFDNEIGPLVTALIQQHERLGKAYEDALLRFDGQDPLGHRQVDHLVRGMDRGPTKAMGVLIETIKKSIDQRMEAKLQQVQAGDDSFRERLLFFTFLIFLTLMVLGAGLTILLRRFRCQAKQIIDMTEKISGGDLTFQTDTSGIGEMDELGRIYKAFALMTENLVRTVQAVFLQSETVDILTEQLSEIKNTLEKDTLDSKQLSEEVLALNSYLHDETNILKSKAEESTDDVQKASQAIDRFSNNIRTIASASQEASQSVSMVATSAQQMSNDLHGVNDNLVQVNASVQSVTDSVSKIRLALVGVRKQCETAQSESDQASQSSYQTLEAMESLYGSAREIENVVEVINSIAEQTQMLALNAAIEAAGAGEFGKGFAVVANEVKDLARATENATRMIAEKIEEIQSQAGRVAESTRSMATGMNLVRKANEEITQSVADQSDLIQDIANSMDGVAKASEEVTSNAANLGNAAIEVAEAANQASDNTQKIAGEANEASSSAIQVMEGSSGAAFKTKQVQNSAHEVLESAINVQKKTLQLIQISKHSSGSAQNTGKLIQLARMSTDDLIINASGFTISCPAFDIQTFKSEYLSLMEQIENWKCGRSTIQSDQVLSVEETSLGKWRSRTGEMLYGKRTDFKELVTVQEEMHQSATTIARLISERDQLAQEAEEAEDDVFDLFDDDSDDEATPKITLEEVNQQIEEENKNFVSHFQDLFRLLDKLSQVR